MGTKKRCYCPSPLKADVEEGTHKLCGGDYIKEKKK